MRGLRRRSGEVAGGGPDVLDARVLDGEHLLLAVRGHGVPLVLRSADGEVDLATGAGADREGPLTTATVLLAAHAGPDPGTEVRLEILTRDARGRPAPLRGPAEPTGGDGAGPNPGPGLDAPLVPDGTARWEVGPGPGVLLTRRPVPPHVPVVALRGRDGDTQVLLAPGPGRQLDVGRPERVSATFPLEVVDAERLGVRAGTRLLRLGRVLGTAAAQDEGRVGVLHVDGLPLTRARSHLARPQRATELPPLPPATGLELRWTPAGHLALHRSGTRW